MSSSARPLVVALTVLLGLAACGRGRGTGTFRPPGEDASVPACDATCGDGALSDTGTSEPDAATPHGDAGNAPPDAGDTPPDAGDVPVDPCVAFGTACGTCLERAGCGFCTDGSCRTRGTPGCTLTDCSAVCHRLSSSCIDCDATPGCGYCNDTSQCIEGSADAPATPCVDWRPAVDTCGIL